MSVRMMAPGLRLRLPLRRPPRGRQSGAAVLMALFIATLATLIVSGLFWNQFVLLRTIENQQLVGQTRLLLRGALDWSRAILREDQRTSTFDALTEPWAQGLEETRLDQLGETTTLASNATIAGSIEDAQSRMNLRNLIGTEGVIYEPDLMALRRLAVLLQLPEQTADLIAARVQDSIIGPSAERPMGSSGRTAPPIPLFLPTDLAGIPGIDGQAAAKLAPYVVILDERTPVNVNTASAEVIAARIPGLSIADARSLVAERERISYFPNVGSFRNSLRNRGQPGGDDELSVASRYFLVRGQVRLDRAQTRMESLVKRSPQSTQAVMVLWQREL
jgi:general secretion pathway protein K